MDKQNIKKFVKERNEMLLKCDVNELRRFVQNNGQRSFPSRRVAEAECGVVITARL